MSQAGVLSVEWGFAVLVYLFRGTMGIKLKLLQIAVLAVGIFTVCLAPVMAQSSQNTLELVRKTVNNELQSSDDHGRFMFLDRKQTPHGSQSKLLVETKDGMAGLVVAKNDQPLSAQDQKAELARVQRFITNPDELKRKQKQEKEDTEHVNRIMKALPDAFLYEFAGTEEGRKDVGKQGHKLVRLKFKPNPRYDPPSRVEQVLTGMSGTMLIDSLEDRIAEIDGKLSEQVSFGWGILGHLNQGGHFLVQQADVGDDCWEVTRMDLDFTGKILLFKSLSIKSTETSSDFQKVPGNLTFAQGVDLLKKEQVRLAGKQL